jgi:hypothetical protein
MKNFVGVQSAVQFFLAVILLFLGLLNFNSALTLNGTENRFTVSNWGVALAVSLAFLFGVGWWVESFVEHLLLSKTRRIAIVISISFFLIFLSLVLSPLLTPFSFTRFAINASGWILMCGFYLRFSMIRPEVLAKLRQHN